MENQTLSIRLEKPEDYSEEGIKIHCICYLLATEDEDHPTQKQLVEQSARWIESGILASDGFVPARNNAELSKAKKRDTGIPEERAREIRLCLEEMMHLRGFEITRYPADSRSTKYLKIQYRRTDASPKPFIEAPSINIDKLRDYGLLDIISNKPVEHQIFRDALMKSYELRILQSSLFNWREFIELLEHALTNGPLCKVKLLFGQPYSSVAKARAHTFGIRGEDQFEHINSEIKKAVGSITQLAEKYNGRPKPGGKDMYEIQLRLYYRPTAVPLYQCRDHKGGNLLTLMGVYWEYKSSFKSPHFAISAPHGKLIRTLDKQFDFIWEDTENEHDFNWRRHLGRQRTRILLNGDANQKLMKLFKEAYFLQPFAIYHEKKPQWIHFKCFYHNFRNEQREFLLQIAPNERIAKISKTQNKNTYYGVVIKLHSSYALFLHTTNENTSNRIIFLNIPVGGTHLSDKKLRFAIYNNNDEENGSPYSQLMLLRRLKNKRAFKKKKFKFDQFIPFLKEKKIGISSELWNGVNQPFGKLNEDYMYHFNSREKSIFYKNLKGQLANAKNEIYFLGLAPIHFSSSDVELMDDYIQLHEDLIRKKGIQIYRILLEPKADKRFIESILSIKKDPEIADAYRLFVAQTPIPVLNDLVLIDPEEPSSQTAILAFIKMRKNADISVPIRLEVIRKNARIIDILYDTCLNYINNSELVKELSTVADIKQAFSL